MRNSWRKANPGRLEDAMRNPDVQVDFPLPVLRLAGGTYAIFARLQHEDRTENVVVTVQKNYFRRLKQIRQR